MARRQRNVNGNGRRDRQRHWSNALSGREMLAQRATQGGGVATKGVATTSHPILHLHNGSSTLGPSDSRRRGGHSGQWSQSAREGENRCREGGVPRIGREHGITLAARTLPTTATSAITSAMTAGATTAARKGDGHCYLLDSRISVIPPLYSHLLPKLFSYESVRNHQIYSHNRFLTLSRRDVHPFGSKNL